LILVAAFFAFDRLSYPDIRTWDEGTNAGIVAASLDAGSWPALAGPDGPFFEKPPLWYYAASATVALRGFDAIALRLPAAMAGFVLILLVGFAARRFGSPAAAAVAVLFLLSCGHLFFFKPDGWFSTHHMRSADSDVVQIALMFGAFLAFSGCGEGRMRGLYLGAVLCGLAVMAKGPLGLLPAIVLVAFQIVSPKRFPIGAKHAAIAVLLLVATAGPWHLYMLAAYGRPYFDAYVLHHLVQRATGVIEEHSGPWWLYFMLLTVRRICGSVEVLAIAVAAALVDRRRLAEYRVAAPLLSITLLMLIISSIGTKLAWYMLPLYPYGALLVGDLVDRCRRFGSGGLIAVLAVAAVLGYPAARNARDIARLRRGWMETFIGRSRARCGDEITYDDPRLPGDIAYLLRHERIERAPRGTSRCSIGWRDTEGSPSSGDACRVVDAQGHLALWECRP